MLNPVYRSQALTVALGPLLGAEGLKRHGETCRACRGLPLQRWAPNCRDHFRDEIDEAIRQLGGASLELHDLRRALGGRGRDD